MIYSTMAEATEMYCNNPISFMVCFTGTVNIILVKYVQCIYVTRLLCIRHKPWFTNVRSMLILIWTLI